MQGRHSADGSDSDLAEVYPGIKMTIFYYPPFPLQPSVPLSIVAEGPAATDISFSEGNTRKEKLTKIIFPFSVPLAEFHMIKTPLHASLNPTHTEKKNSHCQKATVFNAILPHKMHSSITYEEPAGSGQVHCTVFVLLSNCL